LHFEAVLVAKPAVGLDAVFADPQHHGVAPAELLCGIAERSGFAGAARRVVFRVKVDDHVFSPELGQRDLPALARG
jgi:hypothetical protein